MFTTEFAAGSDADDRQQGLLPLIVGATGHRDLRPEDHRALTDSCRSVLSNIQSSCPHTPIVLLSPLAEGADRLVARVAMELGIFVGAPLPMEQSIYETDFTAEGSVQEFRDLLAHVTYSVTLPLAEGNTADSIAAPGVLRDKQYTALGLYLIEHSQLLIALWDGTFIEGGRGTSHVVCQRLRGSGLIDPSTESLIDEPEPGAVYHIFTPRVSGPPAKKPAGLLEVMVEMDSEEEGDEAELRHRTECNKKRFAQMLKMTDVFNRDAIDLKDQLRSVREESASKLIPERECEVFSRQLRRIRDEFAFADSLAVHFHRRASRSLPILFSSAFVAIICFQVYAHVLESPFFLLLYPSVLYVAAGYWWLIFQRGQCQEKHQDYRALAEGLRVEFYWRLAQIGELSFHHYLRKQRTEMDWIRYSVRSFTSLPSATDSAISLDGAVKLAQAYWVSAQRDYFAGTANDDRHRARMCETWVKIILNVGPVVAFVLGLSTLACGSNESSGALWRDLIRACITTVALTTAVGALLHTYEEKRGFSQHAKQYELMRGLFSRAHRRIQDAIDQGDGERARQLLFELGKEALAEHGDWLLIHRDRPFDVPYAS